MQEEQRELAKTIRVSGSILLSTVSNFLDFFKMEAGKQLDVVRTDMSTKASLTTLMQGLLHYVEHCMIQDASTVLLHSDHLYYIPEQLIRVSKSLTRHSVPQLTHSL